MTWPAVEIVEAAARAGTIETVASAYRRLSEMTSASGTN
jgi:hypothetical protein